MAHSFMDSPSYLFTSESVTEGHPDKLCDQVSDAVLDAILADDPAARVACETCTTTGLVVVMGEITTQTYVDIPNIVRHTIRDAGYQDSSYGFDYQSCGVAVSVHEQSPDISTGVTRSLEVRDDIGNGGDDLDNLGAGDQGMMVGYACTETPELMPLPIALSHRLCQRMAEVRKEGLLPYLRPDGKSQVTVEYEYGMPKYVHTVVMSAQHSPEVSQTVIERDLVDSVGKEVIPPELLGRDTRWVVNPSGKFVTGGPVGDTGLTGRKILVDTYGGMARHGGGAFSGKGPDQGRSLSSLCGQVRRQERRCRRACGPRRDTDLVRNRRREPDLHIGGNVRDEQGAGQYHQLAHGKALRPAARSDNSAPGPASSHLLPDGCLRPLRKAGGGLPLGADGQGGSAEAGGVRPGCGCVGLFLVGHGGDHASNTVRDGRLARGHGRRLHVRERPHMRARRRRLCQLYRTGGQGIRDRLRYAVRLRQVR